MGRRRGGQPSRRRQERGPSRRPFQVSLIHQRRRRICPLQRRPHPAHLPEASSPLLPEREAPLPPLFHYVLLLTWRRRAPPSFVPHQRR
ncbi:hypothetical protein Droror1_Dr00023548 [Drosera rotundifolia]